MIKPCLLGLSWGYQAFFCIQSSRCLAFSQSLLKPSAAPFSVPQPEKEKINMAKTQKIKLRTAIGETVSFSEILKRPFFILTLKGKVFDRESITILFTPLSPFVMACNLTKHAFAAKHLFFRLSSRLSLYP